MGRAAAVAAEKLNGRGAGETELGPEIAMVGVAAGDPVPLALAPGARNNVPKGDAVPVLGAAVAAGARAGAFVFFSQNGTGVVDFSLSVARG